MGFRGIKTSDVDKSGLGLVGCIYYDSYWDKVYRVIENFEVAGLGSCIKVVDLDGNVKIHCTKIDMQYDKIMDNNLFKDTK